MMDEVFSKKEFSEYVRYMRIAAKVTQAEMARRLEVSQPAYSAYEHGRALPRNIQGFMAKIRKVVVDEIRGARTGERNFPVEILKEKRGQPTKIKTFGRVYVLQPYQGR